MKQYKHHKLYISRNVLLLLSLIAVMAGGRMLKSAREAVVPTVAAHERWQANYGKLPLSFEINRGQAPKPVEFLAHGDGYNLALLPGEAVLKLSKQKPNADTEGAAAKNVNATLQIKLAGAKQEGAGERGGTAARQEQLLDRQ